MILNVYESLVVHNNRVIRITEERLISYNFMDIKSHKIDLNSVITHEGVPDILKYCKDTLSNEKYLKVLKFFYSNM